MSPEREDMDALLESLASRGDVDWDAAVRDAGSDSERRRIEALSGIARIAEFSADLDRVREHRGEIENRNRARRVEGAVETLAVHAQRQPVGARPDDDTVQNGQRCGVENDDFVQSRQ